MYCLTFFDKINKNSTVPLRTRAVMEMEIKIQYDTNCTYLADEAVPSSAFRSIVPSLDLQLQALILSHFVIVPSDDVKMSPRTKVAIAKKRVDVNDAILFRINHDSAQLT